MPNPSDTFEHSVEQIRLDAEKHEIQETLDGLVAKGFLTTTEKDGETHYRVPEAPSC